LQREPAEHPFAERNVYRSAGVFVERDAKKIAARKSPCRSLSSNLHDSDL